MCPDKWKYVVKDKSPDLKAINVTLIAHVSDYWALYCKLDTGWIPLQPVRRNRDAIAKFIQPRKLKRLFSTVRV